MKRYTKPTVSATALTTSVLLVSGTTISVTVNHNSTNNIKGV